MFFVIWVKQPFHHVHFLTITSFNYLVYLVWLQYRTLKTQRYYWTNALHCWCHMLWCIWITLSFDTYVFIDGLFQRSNRFSYCWYFSVIYLFLITVAWMLGGNTLQWRAQLSERPISGSSVDQSQDREGTGCCRYQTDGPNGPCSLWTQRGAEEVHWGLHWRYNRHNVPVLLYAILTHKQI